MDHRGSVSAASTHSSIQQPDRKYSASSGPVYNHEPPDAPSAFSTLAAFPSGPSSPSFPSSGSSVQDRRPSLTASPSTNTLNNARYSSEADNTSNYTSAAPGYAFPGYADANGAANEDHVVPVGFDEAVLRNLCEIDVRAICHAVWEAMLMYFFSVAYRYCLIG